MAYYEAETVRFNCIGNKDSTSIDTTIALLGPKADAKVDVLLYKQAKRQGKITYLPVLPLQGTAPQSIKDASSNYTTYLYFLQKGQLDRAKEFKIQALEDLTNYIDKLKVDEKIGVVEF